MATGYEVQQFHDIHRIADSLESLARSIQKMIALVEEHDAHHNQIGAGE